MLVLVFHRISVVLFLNGRITSPIGKVFMDLHCTYCKAGNVVFRCVVFVVPNL